MERAKVSIIVPVYNVAAYLPACLESIRVQTWREIEVILVDDGSTDESLSLCRAAAERDARFRVIHQQNAGVSAARNAGLAAATGQYLQFVDGDDRLLSNATEVLVHAALSTGTDLVIARFYRVSGQRQALQGHIRGRRVLTRTEFAEEMVKAPANFYYGVLWNKLYRRSIVEAHQLRCPEELSWCEDFLFNLEYIKYVRLVAAVPEPVCCYIKREDSLVMTQPTLRRTLEMKQKTFSYYKDLYQTLDLYERQKGRVYRYLISAATDGKESFDRDGSAAARGKVCEELLSELKRDEYYALPLPKTTGREHFGTQYTGRLFDYARGHGLTADDLAATATELTAWSIADAYERYVMPKYRASELIVGGGGSYNPTLLAALSRRMNALGVKVRTQEELGFSSDAKEAVAFAIMGDRYMAGLTNTLPSVTGAAHAAIMGKLSLPANAR